MSQRYLFAFVVCCCIIVDSAFAQLQQAEAGPEESIAFFYRDPRPERVPRIIERFEREFADKWGSHPPLAGLLAVVFQKYPEQIEKLVPAAPSSKLTETLVAALRLSNSVAAYQRLIPKFQKVERDARLAAEFANLPSRLEDLQIRSSTHLDIVWGASFAGGDPKYVRMIIDFYARTANRSEHITLDVVQIAIALSGGPIEVPKLGQKYGDELGREIAIAGVALWAIRSNGRQHDYVDKTIGKYVDEHLGTFATKGLAVITGRKN